MNQAMQSQEQAYLDPPDPPGDCESCGTRLRNGRCRDCEAPEYEHEVDFD